MIAAQLILSALAPFVLAPTMTNFGIPGSLVITIMLGCFAIVMFGIVLMTSGGVCPTFRINV